MVCQCSMDYCGGCRNKLGCLKYLQYLERIASLPIPTPPTNPPSINFEPVITALTKVITEQNSALTSTLQTQYETIETKLDDLAKTPEPAPTTLAYEKNDAEQPIPENSIIVYDSAPPMQKGDTYIEEKKTIFGGTKMVERKVK